MKKIMLVSSILVCFAFTASTFAQKGKPAPGCGSDVSVGVLIDPFAIAPDVSAKWYVNAQEKVQAIFQVGNCSQDFTMNLNTSSRFIRVTLDATSYTSKFFNFDRVASVPVTPTTSSGPAGAAAFLSSPFCTNGGVSLGGFNVPLNSDGTYQDNYAGCSVDGNGNGYVRRNVGFGLVVSGNTQLGFRFQYSPIDGGINVANVSGTVYVRVYHPNSGSWEIVPDDQSNLGSASAPFGVRLLNGADNGRFAAPFRISVVRL